MAPQFLADVDLKGRKEPWPGTLFWDAEGWKGGERALGSARLSSFTAMDRLLEQLTGPERLPGDRKPAVVIFGNSAGGQYVNRYAAVGRGPALLAGHGIDVRFVISNPSTYLYFTKDRPEKVAGTSAAAMAQGANRYERGINYRKYIGELARDHALGDEVESRHRLIELDGVGHSAGDVMAAGQTRKIIFG